MEVLQLGPGVQISAEFKELSKALTLAQPQIQKAKLDKENGSNHKWYSTYDAVLEACKEALNINGIAVSQLPVSHENKVGVTTMLLHESGQFLSGTLLVDPKAINSSMNDTQAVGNAITYCKRYGLESIVCVISEPEIVNRPRPAQPRPTAPVAASGNAPTSQTDQPPARSLKVADSECTIALNEAGVTEGKEIYAAKNSVLKGLTTEAEKVAALDKLAAASRAKKA